MIIMVVRAAGIPEEGIAVTTDPVIATAVVIPTTATIQGKVLAARDLIIVVITIITAIHLRNMSTITLIREDLTVEKATTTQTTTTAVTITIPTTITTTTTATTATAMRIRVLILIITTGILEIAVINHDPP